MKKGLNYLKENKSRRKHTHIKQPESEKYNKTISEMKERKLSSSRPTSKTRRTKLSIRKKANNKTHIKKNVTFI